MTKFTFYGLGKAGVVTFLGLGALSLGACSTTSGMIGPGNLKMGAPITYKIDQAGKYISPQAPRSMASLPKRPQASLPKLPNYRPNHQLGTPPKLKNVDTNLYAHQKVGRPYTIFGKRYTPKHQPKYDTVGTASWYGDKFHGKPTATGEIYDMNDITAAHKTMALNSMVLVTNVETGKQLMVRVNDRGPFIGDRIIDLSRAAAQELGMFTSGLAKVRVQYAGPADPMAAKKRKPRKAPKALPKPIPVPALPEPRFEQAPDAVADLPQSIPQYRPLRDLGATPPAQTALPLPDKPRANKPAPRYSVVPRNQIPQPQNAIPHRGMPKQADLPSGRLEDGPITLTIKGPVHMASDNNDGTYEKPRFIPAVNYTDLPAKKSRKK
ncbi:MAG: septal ring lytic transglycosylase RlpA family protein [Robiginitomaculum sp.]|nr:septal ring lytic transglycosylase RlpA family protein [Robiginitomaculum sp.]